MDARFADVVASLHPSFERLLAMPPVSCASLPRTMPASGIYLLSENGRHLYVGRSKGHPGPPRSALAAGCHAQAGSVAFRLAGEATGQIRASYKTEGSRRDLMTDGAFQAAFAEAKARIRAMEVRFVEEADPVRQTILEVYVAVVLQTPYNDFDTH